MRNCYGELLDNTINSLYPCVYLFLYRLYFVFLYRMSCFGCIECVLTFEGTFRVKLNNFLYLNFLSTFSRFPDYNIFNQTISDTIFQRLFFDYPVILTLLVNLVIFDAINLYESQIYTL